MIFLLSLLTGTAVCSLTVALFEWRWGPTHRIRQLERGLQRLAEDGALATRVTWLQRYLKPPEIARPRRFWLLWGLVAVAALLVGQFLAGSILWGLLLVVILVPVFRQTAIHRAVSRRRQVLGDQLKDALSSIATSLRAGNSLVTAFERVVPDLERLLRGQTETPIIEEMARVVQELHLGSSLEEALVRLRDRVQLEDVTDFVNATLLCRVRGGNLPEVVSTIAQIIADKVSVRSQIRVLTAGKRMESTLLTIMPPVLIVGMALSSPGYLQPLLESLFGQLLMILACLLLVGAFLIGRRIVDIEV